MCMTVFAEMFPGSEEEDSVKNIAVIGTFIFKLDIFDSLGCQFSEYAIQLATRIRTRWFRGFITHMIIY